MPKILTEAGLVEIEKRLKEDGSYYGYYPHVIAALRQAWSERDKCRSELIIMIVHGKPAWATSIKSLRAAARHDHAAGRILRAIGEPEEVPDAEG